MTARSIEYAVLCGPEDDAALWAAGALRRSGLDVRLVTTEEVVYSTGLTHTVRSEGVTGEVLLRDGSVLGPDLRGTLNRVTRIPTAHLGGTSAADRDYAVQELQALLTSLLHGLPGVVLGRPDARGLSGAWWRPAEWMVAAGRAGLEGHGFRSGGSDDVDQALVCRVLVVRGEVVGPAGTPVPEPVARGCRRLAGRHGSGLLGLEFAVTGDDWVCTAGTPAPDLRIGGAAAVTAIRTALLAAASPGVSPGGWVLA